ncbi:MAG: PKD domain-containing protein, partial [Sphingobacteriales bacterium]
VIGDVITFYKRAAACTPATLTYCCGYGIYNVSLGDINNSSADGLAGYQDFTCPVRTTLVEGTTYPISITTSAGNNQNTGVWIDYNNDGNFSATENVLTSLNSANPTGTISIPLGTVLNTALRMRVISDFAGGTLSPCNNVQNGQAEDYTVTIIPNTFPPVASFDIGAFGSCDTVRQFINTTQVNLASPASTYLWNFGNGDTSTAVNPVATFSSNAANYTVSLIACNSFGCDTVSVASAVIIDNPCLNYCTPANNNNSNQWISQVEIGSINNTTGAGPGGYSNFTGISTTLVRGTANPFRVILGNQNVRSISVWIDYNRNGIFEFSERLVNLQSQALVGNQWGRTGTLAVPAGNETGQARMRVIIRSVTNGTDPCISNSFNTDVEDYTIFLQNPTPVVPVPALSSNQASICTGLIAFQDLSLNQPTSWSWDFGDGSTLSTLQNPTHTYQVTNPATYTVSLTVCNSAGCSTVVKPGYVVITNPCTVPYCPSSGHGNATQHIAKVAVGTINNASTAAANGYSNFTSQTTEVLIGTQTNLTVALANNNQAWQIAAWIDYNHNAVFDVAERVFFGPSTALTGGGYGRTGGFAVPNTTVPGVAVMRIIARIGLNNDPCAMNLASAETEDYLVNLVTSATNNVGVMNIVSPVSACTLSAASVVCIQVANLGTATQSNIPVQYTLNNVQSAVELVPGPLAPGESTNFCFAATANMASAGNYNLMTQTVLPGDAQASNNTFSQVINSFPLPNSTFTYSNSGLQYTFSTSVTPGTGYNWDFGDGNSSGSANPIHTFAANGTYTVTLTKTTSSGCTSSTSQTITGVSAAASVLAAQVTLYPNPSLGVITVNIPLAGNLEVINALGQVVYRMKVAAADNLLLLTHLPRGMYSVRIVIGEETVNRKMILE